MATQGLERCSICCFIIAQPVDFHKPVPIYDDTMIRRSSMFDQSIAGIRANLETFSQAAARIAQPQTTDELAGKSERQSPWTSTRAKDDGSPKETANDPGTRSKTSKAVDLATETVDMMVARHGVEANLGVLKTALSLSGQTVDILA